MKKIKIILTTTESFGDFWKRLMKIEASYMASRMKSILNSSFIKEELKKAKGI